LSLIRKVIWPAAIALGFLVFLGAIGSGNVVRTASADDEGDICEIVGPEIIAEDETYIYIAYIDADDSNEYTVSIDNISGQSQITSVVDDDGESYDKLKGTNVIHDVEAVNPFELSDLVLAELLHLDDEFAIAFDQCAERSTLNSIRRIIQDIVLECDTGFQGGFEFFEECSDISGIDGDEINAAAQAILDALNAGEDDCEDIATDAAKAAIGAGADSDEANVLFEAIVLICEEDWDFAEVCDKFVHEEAAQTSPSTASVNAAVQENKNEECSFDDDSFLDSAIIVDVTCLRAGEFDLTFADQDEDDDSMTLKVLCQGPPDDATITANPNRVEIVPALGNVSHSLITVVLLDENDDPAGPGSEVDFTVDRCTIETSGVDTPAEYMAARTLFVTNLNPAVPASAANVEASAAATSPVDGTRQQDTTISFVAVIGGDDTTVAAAILGCSPADTGATVATPGIAKVTAIIEVEDGQDIIRTVDVTVIGPPHTLTVAAAPSSLRCGEKATITATVKDSIGQNVSEHTRVEAVTNAGGVLGGTGAVAGLAGPVVPISSTVAETFNGVATFYLLTSEQHSGPYEVVVTTGGAGAVTQSLGGVFSTPPLSAQATVSCSIPTVVAPAPAAPTITAPRTGTGITPPNTGDAGLVDTTGGSSWALFAAVGAVAFAVAGLASLKFARKS
jgi:hypothetical protein